MSSYRFRGGRGDRENWGYNARGGARGSTSTRRFVTTRLPTLVSDEPYGPEIDKINDISSLLIEHDAPIIENLNYLASYNWLDSESPIILVPGSPPAWTPPTRDVKLPGDSGKVYRDINGARYPAYPLEPAIRSILALEPQFDLQAVDLVACGSTIGNLLRFASAQEKPFRFDADFEGDTVFFIRKERTPTETIDNLRGYGHTFPEHYTTWDRDVGGSCSHQRIVEYDFADLHILVRSESDGYVKEKDEGTRPMNASKDNVQSSLDETFTKLGVGSTPSVSDQAKLDLRMQGVKRPQSQIFDLKTRRELNIFDMEEILPRLWVNQTPNFLLAYHEFGLFKRPQVSNVKDQVLEWQERNTTLLSKLHVIIKRIMEIVKDSEDHRVEVSWDGKGPLRVTEQIKEGNRVLPIDLLQKWEDIDID